MPGSQGNVHVTDASRSGAFVSAFHERINSIFGVTALNLLVLGGAEILMLLGFADLVAFLFSRNHSVADLPFQIQTIGLIGLSFGFCILALSVASATLPDIVRVIFGNRHGASDRQSF
jgi:hypothetical protein